MRIEMQIGHGSAASFVTKNEQDTIEQVIALLKNPDVHSVTIRKQTSKKDEQDYDHDNY